MLHSTWLLYPFARGGRSGGVSLAEAKGVIRPIDSSRVVDGVCKAIVRLCYAMV